MNVFEIISLALNFLLASGLVGTMVFYQHKKRQAKAAADSADLENTDRIVKMQTEHIGRLDLRVEKLEEKVDKLEIIIEIKKTEIERKNLIIRQAFKCSTPPDQCPVLIRRGEIDKQLKDQKNEQRITKS